MRGEPFYEWYISNKSSRGEGYQSAIFKPLFRKWLFLTLLKTIFMNQIIKNLGTRFVSWLAENTAPTYLDRGFFNVSDEALFIDRTQWILRESFSAYKQEHLSVLEAYYKRYLHAENFLFSSKFILDMNEAVIRSIATRRESLTLKNQALIIKLNEAIAQN